MKKYIYEIEIGDRIDYMANDLVDRSLFDNPYTPLRGDVVGINDFNNLIQLRTSTHLLIPYHMTSTFELADSDFSDDTQAQYNVNTAETFNGVSIE